MLHVPMFLGIRRNPCSRRRPSRVAAFSDKRILSLCKVTIERGAHISLIALPEVAEPERAIAAVPSGCYQVTFEVCS